MEDLAANRTPPVIAAEINAIKYQAGRIFLMSAVEIGRRLKEVKEMLPYGQWQNWLEDSVDYSVRTAQRLVRIYEEYNGWASLREQRSLPELNYNQALILLGVPKEEREQFIVDLDVESMSSLELKKAVKERSQAVVERDQALQEKAALQKDLDEKISELTRIAEESERLKTEAEESKKAQEESEARAKKLSTQYDTLQQSTNLKEIERMNRVVDASFYKASSNKVAFILEDLTKSFKDLKKEMAEFAERDPDGHEVYRQKVMEFLRKSLLEKI